jgi:phenylalanyl-tRNA synthetase beta chain
MMGVAREIAAIQGVSMTPPVFSLPDVAGDIGAFASVTIEAPDHCPRYAARLLDRIVVAPSPHWLQDRLRSVGVRPINNLVDVTNFVMLETGQPLHAFDFDQLVRSSYRGSNGRGGGTVYHPGSKASPDCPTRCS